MLYADDTSQFYNSGRILQNQMCFKSAGIVTGINGQDISYGFKLYYEIVSVSIVSASVHYAPLFLGLGKVVL